MKLNEYQKLSKRTYPKGKDFDENIMNFTLGLISEGGEVGDMVKKYKFHGHNLDTDEVVKELGDIMFYISSMATLLGVDLSEVAEVNVEKLERRYPNGFSEKDSKKRVE